MILYPGYEVTRFAAKNAALGGAAYKAHELAALQNWVRDKKMLGTYPTYGAFYPLAGPDAISQSLNLLNPEQNRITWTGDTAGNHATTGWTANSSGAYGQTGFNATSFVQQDMSIRFYARTRPPAGAADMGHQAGNNTEIIVDYGDNTTYFDLAGIRILAGNGGNRTGHWLGNWSGTDVRINRNGSALTSGVISSATFTNNEILLGAWAPNNSAGGQYGMFGLWNGVPLSKIAQDYQIDLNLMTAFNRNV